jgi:hypothetical protein
MAKTFTDNNVFKCTETNLKDDDYKLFLKNRYDRDLGGVYLHWAQVGKTHFEVFRDEHGADVDNATCSAINSLKILQWRI